MADLAVSGEEAWESGRADVEGGPGEDVGVDQVAELAREVQEVWGGWLCHGSAEVVVEWLGVGLLQ